MRHGFRRPMAPVLVLSLLATASALSTIAPPRAGVAPARRHPPQPPALRRAPPSPPKLVDLRTPRRTAARVVDTLSDPTSVLRAAGAGNLTRLEEFAAGGGDLAAVVDRNGCGCAHRAAGGGHAGALAFLLRAGCDAAAAPKTGKASKRGRTPLHFAARGGDTTCLELLRARGARVDAETGDGQTPLMWAAFHGRAAAAAYLVDRGASTAARHPRTGCTVAHWCGAGGDVATARFLHGRGVDFAAPNAVGHTPLNKAAAKGHFEMVEWILGVVDPSNVLVRDATGRSAADAAADARFPHLAALLEERVRAAEDAHRRRYEAAGYNIFR